MTLFTKHLTVGDYEISLTLKPLGKIENVHIKNKITGEQAFNVLPVVRGRIILDVVGRSAGSLKERKTHYAGSALGNQFVVYST